MSPRKNESKFKIPGYDHLYWHPGRPGIYYKRWSPEKQRPFVYSTGFDNPKEASKLGKKEYDDWLGVHVDSKGLRLIRDFGRAVLASKVARKGGKGGPTYESARVQIMNHIIPHFGHLKPIEVTPLRWDLYDAAERTRIHKRLIKNKAKKVIREIPYTRTKTAHTRKHLLEILRRAKDEGLIPHVPKLKNHDGESAPPRYIPKATILDLIRAAGRGRRAGHWGRGTKFLIYILWKTGARPGEALQYRWDMLRLETDGTWFLDIPAAITKTNRARSIPLNRRLARLLARLKPRATGPHFFPAPPKPGKAPRPVQDYKSGWTTACERLGVDFDAYNLRDTFITDAIKRKESLSDIARYVDNSAAIIDAKYAVALRESLKGVAGP